MFNLQRLSPLLSLALVFAVVAAAVTVATAQIKKGKTRPATTAQLMKGFVKPSCEALKKGLEASPASDEAWQELALRAALLNESSFTLMDDDRCPDAVWADALTKFLRPGSAAALQAIEAKDYDATKAAFATVMSPARPATNNTSPRKNNPRVRLPAFDS